MSENINELVNGVISTKKLKGAETFEKAEGSPLVAADIVGDTNRGTLAEFILARAIGSEPCANLEITLG